MPTTLDVIRDRIASVCATSPFAFSQATRPFDFDREPKGFVGGVFRLTTRGGSVIGGFNYSEERTDLVEIWVAKKRVTEPETLYRELVTAATSLRAAVIRDGLTAGGDYHVPPDGGDHEVRAIPGTDYAVLRVALPVNFEATV